VSAADPRAVARSALEQLRDHAVCGMCRKDYETMIDALARDGEFEDLMRRIVEREREHPEASHLEERAGQIAAARDEAHERLFGPGPRTPAGRTAGGVGVIRSWIRETRSVVPRPLGIRRDPKEGG